MSIRPDFSGVRADCARAPDLLFLGAVGAVLLCGAWLLGAL
ncbi:MAG: hypothetical protein ACM3SO_03925 [Betaproteobacteria bacterium]